MEVLPQVGLERHGGIGYELVLARAVPQGVWEAETALNAFLKGEKEKEEAKEKNKAMTRKVAVQANPEVQGGVSSRAAPPEERMGGGKVPRVIPPRRISERIHEQIVVFPGLNTPQKQISKRIEEQIVEVPWLHGISQERISEHIVEQIVDDSVPQVIPQKRISKRFVEQNTDEPGLHGIPQERISERIKGRIGGNPSTSSSAAAALNSAKWLGDGGFRTFSPGKKSATTRCESSAALGAHSSSWTPAPYQEEELRHEEEVRHDQYIASLLGPDWRERALRGDFGRGEGRRERGGGDHPHQQGASEEAVQ